MFYTEYTLSELNHMKFNSFWCMILWTTAHIGLLKTYKTTNFKQIINISNRPNKKKLHNHYKNKIIQKDRDVNWLKKLISSFVNGLHNSLYIKNSFIDYIDNTLYQKIIYICYIIVWMTVILFFLLLLSFLIDFIYWINF